MQNRKTRIGYVALVCCLAVGMAYGASNGEKVKVQGMITGRTGESVTIKTTDGSTVAVVLNDDTKVQQPKGLGLRKKQMSATILVPGLKISVDGVGDAQSRVVAKSITFTSDDLETAEAIQAGLTPIVRPTNRPLKPMPRASQRTRCRLRPTSSRLLTTRNRSTPTSRRFRQPRSVSLNSLNTTQRATLWSTSQWEAA